LGVSPIMIKSMKIAVVVAVLASVSYAGIADDAHMMVIQNQAAPAEAALKTYRAQNGVDSEYIDGLSWLARGMYYNKQLERAEELARETESLAKQQLGHKRLDADGHLAEAVGAAIEVQSQVLSARGQKEQAAVLLRRAITTYGNTSIRARLQKNLNLISFSGKAAPELSAAQHLGPTPTSLAQLKGSPVLLFFWAHWCPDCKTEGPIITQLRSEFGPKGLMVLAPTQYYGYAAHGEDAKPADELKWIEKVWRQFYPGLQSVPVPVSKANFDGYGASTTPTIVLLGKDGRVALYHPGAMPYQELRAAVEKVAN
jgi:thiol-disulfide isomerase/thioredoxin